MQPSVSKNANSYIYPIPRSLPVTERRLLFLNKCGVWPRKHTHTHKAYEIANHHITSARLQSGWLAFFANRFSRMDRRRFVLIWPTIFYYCTVYIIVYPSSHHLLYLLHRVVLSVDWPRQHEVRRTQVALHLPVLRTYVFCTYCCKHIQRAWSV